MKKYIYMRQFLFMILINIIIKIIQDMPCLFSHFSDNLNLQTSYKLNMVQFS